ncbi:MAG: transposase [Alcanivoracaceae bacterium]|nr:transposase [Alcanivoracaceae bacterium]
MSNYKRIFLDNHYYFLTVIINNRKLTLLTDYINEFKLALKAVKSQYAFDLHAISVMPDHFHMIIMPNVAKEYPTIIACIKRDFTKSLDKATRIKLKQNLSLSKRNKIESGVWQRRYFEHTIRNQEELNHFTDYIHFNPVKHGCVQKAIDWPYSSFVKFVSNGYYDESWCDFTEGHDYE